MDQAHRRRPRFSLLRDRVHRDRLLLTDQEFAMNPADDVTVMIPTIRRRVQEPVQPLLPRWVGLAALSVVWAAVGAVIVALCTLYWMILTA